MASDADIKSNAAFVQTVSEFVLSDESNSTIESSDTYTNFEKTSLPKGADTRETPDGQIRDVEAPSAPRSIISNYHLLRVKTINDGNYPLTDEETANRQELFKNVTAKQLVQNPRGASIYRPEDFLYASKFGIIPNNRMITLRRFRYPVPDDIFTIGEHYQSEPDVARMIGYSDQETNRLSELLSFSFGMRWSELVSEFSEANYIGDSFGVDGFAGTMLSFLDPAYAEGSLMGANRLKFDPTVDTNKTHGPVDVIDTMKIRATGLNFDQTIRLVFEYDMKSINGTNQKAAFLDILGNILLMSTNEATFWGGYRYHVGRQPSKYAHNLKFMEAKDFDSFLNGANVSIKSAISTFSGGDGAKESAIDTLKHVAKNALSMSFGKVLDKLGRPAIPYMRSLLTGDATGEHHLTVGNPLNPIVCIGDLNITSTELTFGDTLGYDDFPTYMRAEITLQHNKTKDRGGIENMFNAGRGRVYMKPKDMFPNAKARPTSKAEPKLVSDLFDYGANALLGDFTKTDAIRNSFSLWKMNLEK